MDYVYICRDGDNEELRYSLRATAENLPSGRVWVVGGKPDWYLGDYIEVPQQQSKQENAKANWKAAVSNPHVSESIIMMNDDFFTIKKLSNIPVLNGGLLSKKIAQYSKLSLQGSYTKRLMLTYRKLKASGHQHPIDYEMHVPMQITKSGIDEAQRRNYLMIRTAYGNIFDIGGEETKDIKVYESGSSMSHSYDYLSGVSPYLSSNDASFATLGKDILFDMFPSKSQYEK